jgi:tetratricopeptide (TPR) repeat protein
MARRFSFPVTRLLLTVAIFFVCGLAVAPNAMAQLLPKKTDRVPETRPTTSSARRERRKAHQPASSAPKSPASVESNKFLDLGDVFREKNRWKAAEASYKEAVRVWPGNADALSELGYLYIDMNKIDDAQQTYSRLRSVNSSYAAELLSDINRRKNQIEH